MSSVFIAYNEEKISNAVKRKIGYVLDYGDIKKIQRKEEDYNELIGYLNFGKLQIVYSRSENDKFKLFVSSRYLICISGIIANQKNLLKKYKFDDIFSFLIQMEKDQKKFLNFFKEFKGQFVIFFYDKKDDNYYLINDQLGFCSAFFYKSKNVFCYSNCPEALLFGSEPRKEINYDAIADYLSLGIVQNRETFIKGINNLPEASLLCKNGSIKKYHDFDLEDSSYSEKKYLPLINESLLKSVNDLYKYSSKKTYVNLTGGFDTRLINSLLLESGKKQTIIFTRLMLKDKNEINKYALKTDEKIGREFANKYQLQYKLKERAPLHEPLKRRTFFELHGLFGGELLGAEAYNQPATLFSAKIPSSGKNHFFTSRFKNLLNRDPIENYYKNINAIKCSEWDKKVFLYKAKLILTSFYNNLEKYENPAWTFPRLFFLDDSLAGGKMFLYPYLDTDFLKILFKIPFKELQGRKFYNALLEKYYSEYLSVDILHGKKRYYKYNKNTKKLYIYKKIEKEMEKQKNKKLISEKEQKEKGIKDFLYYLNCPIDIENIDKGFFFFKEISLKENDLLFHRIENLQNWFKQNIYQNV